MTRLIDADELHEIVNWSHEKPPYSKKKIHRLIDMARTVEAVPVSFIQQRIDHLQNVADFALESNGGYIESANSSLYELKMLLSSWENEKRKQNDF